MRLLDKIYNDKKRQLVIENYDTSLAIAVMEDIYSFCVYLDKEQVKTLRDELDKFIKEG